MWESYVSWGRERGWACLRLEGEKASGSGCRRLKTVGCFDTECTNSPIMCQSEDVYVQLYSSVLRVHDVCSSAIRAGFRSVARHISYRCSLSLSCLLVILLLSSSYHCRCHTTSLHSVASHQPAAKLCSPSLAVSFMVHLGARS